MPLPYETNIPTSLRISRDGACNLRAAGATRASPVRAYGRVGRLIGTGAPEPFSGDALKTRIIAGSSAALLRLT